MATAEPSLLVDNEDEAGRDLYKTRRTKAMPKHTLFGAGLELLEKEQLQNMKRLDGRKFEWEEIEANKKPSKILPAAYRAHLLDSRHLTDNAAELHRNLQTAKEAKVTLDILEKQSRYFGVDSREKPSQLNSADKRKIDQWFSRKDLEHTQEINKVGLNNRSYNYDKYGRRPPIHQYSMIGSILQPGMDFNDAEKEEIREPLKKPEVRKNPDWLARENYEKQLSAERASHVQTFSGIQLPKNIQHQFGTKVCQSLLSDTNLVHKTLEQQDKLKQIKNRRRLRHSPQEVARDPNLDPTYDDLGSALRHNIFPGQTYDHKIGVIKGDFNDSVYKNRVPDPDEFRYQRDELSAWAEHNVLRDRVKKAWDNYKAEAMGKAN